MGYLTPPLPKSDGSDILIMLKRLRRQQIVLGFVLGSGIFGLIAIAALVWVTR